MKTMKRPAGYDERRRMGYAFTPAESRYKAQQDRAERAAAIFALGWRPEPEGAFATGDDYAASTADLIRWAKEGI